MTRRLKLISLLITISLIGIIIIQVSWIRNSVILKKEQFSENVNSALYEVSEKIHDKRDSILESGNPLYSQLLNSFLSTDKFISEPELHDMIANSLRDHSIQTTQFEFCVQNRFGQSILFSPNFSYEDLQRSYSQELSQDIFNSEELYLYINQSKNDILRSVFWLVLAAFIFTLIIIGTFYITIGTLINQKKLNEMKTNFINNMTHEFKTPLATISLAVDALNNSKVYSDKEKHNYYTDIIKEENKRMNNQVEKILQTAKIERSSLKLIFEEVDVHDMLIEVIQKYELQILSLDGTIHFQPLAAHHIAQLDKFHTTNALSNLLDNAIKYRKPDVPVEVDISTKNIGNSIIIRIADNGLGMTKEVLSRIFETFYRADTGNLHNVKGFGLGLAYAKNIIEAENGKIKAESTIGKGSVFTVTLPLTQPTSK